MTTSSEFGRCFIYGEARQSRMNIADWRRTSTPVGQHMPVKFSSGTSLESLTAGCSGCDKDIAPDNFRGQVLCHEKLVQVSALGLCETCWLFTPFHYDVWDDLTLIGRRPVSGEIQAWKPK